MNYKIETEELYTDDVDRTKLIRNSYKAYSEIYFNTYLSFTNDDISIDIILTWLSNWENQNKLKSLHNDSKEMII